MSETYRKFLDHELAAALIMTEFTLLKMRLMLLETPGIKPQPRRSPAVTHEVTIRQLERCAGGAKSPRKMLLKSRVRELLDAKTRLGRISPSTKPAKL